MRTKRPERATLVAFAVAVSIVALLIAIFLQVLVLNPKAENNRLGLIAQQSKLHSLICSQAQMTANAYRFRALTPSGQVEPIPHFLTRMQAQRQTLRLSRGLGCESAPGFPLFAVQIDDALEELEQILRRYRELRSGRIGNLGDEFLPPPAPEVIFPSAPSSGHAAEPSPSGPPSTPHQSPPKPPYAPPPPPASGEPPNALQPPPMAPEAPRNHGEEVSAVAVEAGPVRVAVEEPPLCTVVRKLHDLC